MAISTTLARVKSNLCLCEISPTAFSSIAGIPSSTFNSALAGQRYLGAVLESELHSASTRLMKTVLALRPLSADWSTLKTLIENKTPDEVRALVDQFGLPRDDSEISE